MTEFKAFIVILKGWLLAQIFIAPLIIDCKDGKTALVVDFGALALLIVMYFGLKLIGV